MMRSFFTTTAALLVLPLLCGWPCGGSAQGLTNTISKNQAPLARTFPPTSAEQTPAGTGKFVIFTREATDKTNEWDFIAGAWEAIPSQADVPITKRVEFGHSSWEAQLLLNCLVRDEIEGLYPQFVKLMVDAGGRDYRVNLYDINYRTWNVRCLWQGDRLNAFGVMKDFVFCQNSRDRFRIDVASGNIVKDVPFIPLEVNGAFWLVRKIGEKSGAWSYDIGRQKFAGHFDEVEDADLAHYQWMLSSDGRNRACILIPKPKEWRDGLIDGVFLLQRSGLNGDIQVPVQMLTQPIRGTSLLRPVGVRLSYATNGTVAFSARQQINGKEERVWTIDIKSGKVAERAQLSVELEEDDFSLFDGVPAPDYLRRYLKDFRHFGRGGLAPAFLMHLGILENQPEFPDCTAGVSRDGRHILYKAKEGPLADVFIYGDLQTKQTVRWPCPTGIKRGDSLEFVWVETQ